MTYTFKLSRRLAVSRYAMLAAAAVLVGCDSETTAPESDLSPGSTLARVHLVPNKVTVETNQLVQFRAVRQSPRGERHELPLTWHASGGSIDDSGIFTAAEPGVYKVIGKGRGRQKPDTSIVVVVPPQPNIVAVSVSPDTTTLGLGGSHGFAAVGVRSDGTTVPVGVNWRATGGSVDAGGVYTAGADAGLYSVIAANTEGTLADTAAVTIDQPPPPPPAPTLEQVILSPGTLALGAGATAQLAAYGRTSLGDSVAVEVTYSATGGSIRSDGLYTAGSTAGSFRIIASAGTFADTTSVSLTAPPPPPTQPPTQRPFAVGFWEYPTTLCNATGVTGSARTRSTANVLEHLQTARKCGMRVVLVPSRSSITTTGTTKAPFSLDSAKAYIDRLATVLVPDTLAKYDAEIVGLNLADDYGSTDQWGGTTVSPSQIEAWARYTRAKMPTLRLGVRVEATWVTASLASTIDYAWAQYHKGKGDPTTYFNRQRDVAASLGISLATGVNTTHCGGAGSTFCTPEEIRTFMGMAVQRPESCGAWAWDYDTTQMAVSGMPEAWAYVVNLAKQRGSKPCAHR